MPVLVRPADLVRERKALVCLFQRLLSPQSDEDRFEWLYCAGPHGSARAWVLCESGEHEIFGVAAAFPRRISFNGNRRLVWVLGDFCLDERYRSLGPALQLQRACLNGVCVSAGDVCYDFPSERMMAIYNRLSISRAGELVRWAKPLRANRRIEGIVRFTPLAKAIGAPVGFALEHIGWKGQANDIRFELFTGRCGEEFSALNRQVCSQPGIFTDRSAEYLNWRYLCHPADKYEILTARRTDTLVGYAVFASESGQARIVDLCSLNEPPLVAALLDAVSKQVKPRGVETLSLNAGNAHPWTSVLERAGFRRRESAPVVALESPTRGCFQSKHLPAWYLMHGDRES